MGRIVAPFGVRGWIKIDPYTAMPDGLKAYPRWWIGKEGNWREWRHEQARAQMDMLVAKLAGCEDRDAAVLLKGAQIAVGRDEFPPAGANEYYRSDLIGLTVVNEAGVNFGVVKEVLETGANDVLTVAGERERLIPFIDSVIRSVDLPARMIRVDWDAEF